MAQFSKYQTTLHFFSACICIAGNPFDTTQPVNYAVSNIISAIVYGKRFDYEDPKFQDMVDKANKNVQMIGSVVIQVVTSDLCFGAIHCSDVLVSLILT